MFLESRPITYLHSHLQIIISNTPSKASKVFFAQGGKKTI